MGQSDAHIMKKKLSTSKLGDIRTYEDVIRMTINATDLCLTLEDLTGDESNQSICYQLLRQFAGLFLRSDWKRWSNVNKEKHPQLPYYLARR